MDLFHGIIILLSPFKFALQASFQRTLISKEMLPNTRLDGQIWMPTKECLNREKGLFPTLPWQNSTWTIGDKYSMAGPTWHETHVFQKLGPKLNKTRPKATLIIKMVYFIYTEIFASKILLCKKRFGFNFDQSERRNEFLTREKIVSSNHKARLKRIVFSRAFSRSSRVALSGSFDKIIFSVYSSCS